MGFKENFKRNIYGFNSWLNMWNPKEFLNRAHPLQIIFVFGLIFVIVGAVVSFLNFLVLAGGFIILVYLVYLIIFLKGGFW